MTVIAVAECKSAAFEVSLLKRVREVDHRRWAGRCLPSANGARPSAGCQFIKPLLTLPVASQSDRQTAVQRDSFLSLNGCHTNDRFSDVSLSLSPSDLLTQTQFMFPL